MFYYALFKVIGASVVSMTVLESQKYYYLDEKDYEDDEYFSTFLSIGKRVMKAPLMLFGRPLSMFGAQI